MAKRTTQNIHLRFVAAAATLLLYLRKGKLGFNVAASIKEPGKKAVTGSHRGFEFVADDSESVAAARVQAEAALETLKTDALAKGWTAKVKPAKKVRVRKERNTFVDIPDASTFTPAPTEQAADQSTEPPAESATNDDQAAPDAAIDQKVVEAANNLTPEDMPSKKSKKNRK